MATRWARDGRPILAPPERHSAGVRSNSSGVSRRSAPHRVRRGPRHQSGSSRVVASDRLSQRGGRSGPLRDPDLPPRYRPVRPTSPNVWNMAHAALADPRERRILRRMFGIGALSAPVETVRGRRRYRPSNPEHMILRILAPLALGLAHPFPPRVATTHARHRRRRRPTGITPRIIRHDRRPPGGASAVVPAPI